MKSLDYEIMANPNKFNDNLKERILKLAEEGKTLKEIAFFVGVSERSLYNWAGKHKDFKKALQESKAIADELVEASLFQRAVGYRHKAVKVFFDKESLQTVEHKYTEHYPPDTSAAIFWLSNRDPNKWADKKKIEHSGKIESMTDEEIQAKIDEKLKARSKK